MVRAVVVVPRWLVPILLALVLATSSVTVWASAGMVRDTTCCCPEPKTCKCREEDRDPGPSKLKRCGGEATHLAPALVAADVPVTPISVDERRAERFVSHVPVNVPPDRMVEVEVPPF
jgi:hypothetical protein